MRILRLVAEDEFAIEFHPYIAVVTGLDGDRRDRIVEAIEKAATGRTTPLRGLIEVHGVAHDLDDRTLDLLELDDSGGATTVVADDLPGSAPDDAVVDGVLADDEHEEQIEDLDAGLSLHRLYDPGPIQDALDDLRAARRTGEMVQSAEASSLADRLGELSRDIDSLDSKEPVEASTAALDAAEERLERSRSSLADLERDSAGEDDGGDVSRLERAHAEVERAREALEGRFGRTKAQRRLEVALAAEDELLERLGLQSYTEYLTLGGSVRPEPGDGSDLDAARREVADARAEVAALRASIDDALASVELIGVRVPAAPLSPLDRLAEALSAVGLPVGGLDLSVDEIETMAADWLAEYEHAESRIVRRFDEPGTTVDAVMLGAAHVVDEDPSPVGELEWYLLARLAAQRQQSFVGTLPLVIAGALDGVSDDEGLERLLDRLERMAGAVQIVHITDDPRIVDWADSLEDGRGAVVRPVPARVDAS